MKQKHKNSKKKGFLSLVILLAVALLIGLRLTLNSQLKAAENSQESTTTEVSTKEETETTSEKEVTSSEDSQVDEAETEIEEKDSKKDTKKTKEVKPKITQPQQDSTIYFAEPLVAEILTGDAGVGFDNNDNPGYDSSETNDIVRSFDKIFYSFKINLNSQDKRLYTDIVLKITGKVKNGVTADGRMLNAAFPAINGGGYDLNRKESIINYQLGGKPGSEGANTGSNRTITLPMEVFGAKNGTVLNMEDFTVQILSAKDSSGIVHDLTNEKIIEPIQELKDIKVSSKINLRTFMSQSWNYQFLPFNMMTKSEDDENSNIRQVGMSVAVVPLADRGTSIVGSAAPSGKVSVTLQQKIFETVRGSTTTKELNIGTDTRGMKIFDYGPITSAYGYGNALNQPYNYIKLPNSLYIPFSFKNTAVEINSVYDSGIIKIVNNIDNTITLTFDAYKINMNHVPIKGKSDNVGAVRYLPHQKNILSVGTYVVEPKERLTDNINLSYRFLVKDIQVDEDEKVIIPGDRNWDFSWATEKYPEGSIITYTTYNDTNNQPLSSKYNNIANGGDSKATAGQKFYGRTTVDSGAGFNPEESTLLQKWNPKESKFIQAGYAPASLMSGQGKTTPKPIIYGVSKTGDFSLKSLHNNRAEDYNWFNTPEEAVRKGPISAVSSGATGLRASKDYEYLNVLRQVNQDATGTQASDGTPFVTISHGKLTHEIGKDKSVSSPYDGEPTYIPSTYNDTGIVKYHNPGGLWGDTLLVVPYSVGIEKIGYKHNTTQKATDFQSSDTVTWRLNPKITSTASGDLKAVSVKIEDTLPKGMRYVIDSSEIGSQKTEPTISGPNDQGVTTLVWEFDAVPGKAVPQISYETSFIQSEMTFNSSGVSSLTNTAIISSPGDNSGEKLRKSDYTVNVIKEQKWEIDKTVDKGLIEADSPSPVTYTLKITNQTGKDINGAKVLDVLPVDFDDLGSQFTGGISLKSIKVLGNNGIAINPEAKTYYSFDSIDRDTNPNDIEDDFSVWDQYLSSSGDLDEEVTAIYATIPLLKNEESAFVKITILPTDNEPGDRYRNTASANSKNYSGVINSRVQNTEVINRKISGRVWYDADYNGGIDTNEEFKGNVPVTLYKVGSGDTLTKVTQNIKGTIFVDAAGNSKIKTKANGTYEFDALTHGDYIVGFDVKAEVDAEELYITKQEAAGIIERNNSNVQNNPVALDGKNFLTPVSKKYSLPENIFDPSEGVKEHVNLGVLGKPTIEVQKKVLSEKDASGKREDLNGKTVKVGDTIHYDIEVKNPKKNSVVENVVVKDSIPEGLAFKAGTLTVTDQDGAETPLDDSLFSGRILNTGDIGDIIGDKGVLTVGFDVTIEKSASGILKNIATVTGKVVDKPTDDEKTTNQVVNDTPPLPTLAKEVDVESAKLGDILTYTLTVANKKGGGEWHNVIVTDELPIELSYVANSTQIDGLAKADTGIWSGQKLTLPLPNLQSEDSKVITFKVKVNILPDSRKLVNKVNATGKDKDGKNYNPPEAQVETLMYHQLLHVRQVIINNDGKELVIPSTAYYRVSNQIDKVSTTKISQFALTSGSTTKDSSSEITESLFTTHFIELDKTVKGLLIEDMIPEYYKYVGHIATIDKAKLKEEHLSSKLPTDSGKQLAFVDFSKSEEYWVTIYLEPKFGNDKDDQPEESPRPYSWSNRINDFGVIK
ncbi:isopeptide-forming domain-containing fimbrial protein [Vagococcus salmoninarum]|uniref:DUF11 domain-containing protein n=1 Tax=Vagococcus salmoninarum TaxID=2739 RepID=A0A429ZIM2_9ENTE|nr:isopeptide-forming domain-containing fimbrial protein [Vagococcus salmoninarum]RST93537.1 hypothetical protein CBF35_11470 [Vagococcus salmoninarum]